MEDLNSEETKPIIKKEIITKEIHQWRNQDGTYAEKEDKTNNETTIHLSYDTKNKLKELKTTSLESFREVIERLIKEHFVLQIIKKKMMEKKNESEEVKEQLAI